MIILMINEINGVLYNKITSLEWTCDLSIYVCTLMLVGYSDDRYSQSCLKMAQPNVPLRQRRFPVSNVEKHLVLTAARQFPNNWNLILAHVLQNANGQIVQIYATKPHRAQLRRMQDIVISEMNRWVYFFIHILKLPFD